MLPWNRWDGWVDGVRKNRIIIVRNEQGRELPGNESEVSRFGRINKS